MAEDVRVYGDFHRISPDIYEQLKGAIPFDQVEYDGDVLRVDHEGPYLYIDDFLELIRDLLPENGYGHVEYIDEVDWEVTRYTIKPGDIQSKVVKIDNVVDAHQKEHGL
jgi:hypothetical protein